MSFQNLHSLDRDIAQPLGRILHEAFSDGFRANGEDGYYKFHARPTTAGFLMELKSYFTSTTGIHNMVEATTDYKPGGDTPADGSASIRAISGIGRVKSGFTSIAGGITGLYGQFANVGVVDGDGFYSAIYGLLEVGGGVYTKCKHLSVAWLDSHITETIVAGSTQFLYMTNNGSITFDEVFYIYAGNKISNLFEINTASGMVLETASGGGTRKFKIACTIDGVTGYLSLYTD